MLISRRLDFNPSLVVPPVTVLLRAKISVLLSLSLRLPICSVIQSWRQSAAEVRDDVLEENSETTASQSTALTLKLLFFLISRASIFQNKTRQPGLEQSFSQKNSPEIQPPNLKQKNTTVNI